jgi:hypothetical protein
LAAGLDSTSPACAELHSIFLVASLMAARMNARINAAGMTATWP